MGLGYRARLKLVQRVAARDVAFLASLQPRTQVSSISFLG